MFIVDAFTHYVALNPVPHCNAYYAFTTLYENWIAKFGLPEILVTDNGTEFINKEIITLFNFQDSQITQKEFEQLADLLLKYPKVYGTSKIDVGNVNSPLIYL